MVEGGQIANVCYEGELFVKTNVVQRLFLPRHQNTAATLPYHLQAVQMKQQMKTANE